MLSKWLTSIFVVLVLSSGSVFAAKPVRPPPEPAVPAPEVFSVKVDYINGFVITAGENLSPTTATASFGGVSLTADPASTDTELLFSFTSELSTAIDELGTYILTITTDGGSFTLSAFIPFALVTPPTPPPAGEECPCSNDWDQASTTASPNGFAGQVPYCSEDSASWVTVQFYDIPVGNYWVMWTGWNDVTSSGYCELYIDGPNRTLDTETQFDACAAYLRNIVTVWGDQGNDCIY